MNSTALSRVPEQVRRAQTRGPEQRQKFLDRLAQDDYPALPPPPPPPPSTTITKSGAVIQTVESRAAVERERDMEREWERPDTPPLPGDAANVVLRQLYAEARSLQPHRQESDMVLAGLEIEHKVLRQKEAERNDWLITQAAARISIGNPAPPPPDFDPATRGGHRVTRLEILCILAHMATSFDHADSHTCQHDVYPSVMGSPEKRP